MALDQKDIENRFMHHPPANADVAKTHEAVRLVLMRAVWQLEHAGVPTECREFSLFLTKLEEAMFWANAAVARQ